MPSREMKVFDGTVKIFNSKKIPDGERIRTLFFDLHDVTDRWPVRTNTELLGLDIQMLYIEHDEIKTTAIMTSQHYKHQIPQSFDGVPDSSVLESQLKTSSKAEFLAKIMKEVSDE